MSAKHTPGPWQLEADPCHFDSLTTVTGGQRMNAHPNTWPAHPLTVQVGGTATVKEAQANARRIVACVNACEGFSIDELEGANLFKDSIESQDLIEGLLDVLKHIRRCIPYGGFVQIHDNSMTLAQIDAAIAKVESGAA